MLTSALAATTARNALRLAAIADRISEGKAENRERKWEAFIDALAADAEKRRGMIRAASVIGCS
jgi:hypothetical protein